MWREAWASKEAALRTRFTKSSESLNEHVKQLPPLQVGEKCFIQNQTGNYPSKWQRTGTIVEKGQHNQYIIKMDGSGRLTKRNRRFIRSFNPASSTIETVPPSPTHGLDLNPTKVSYQYYGQYQEPPKDNLNGEYETETNIDTPISPLEPPVVDCTAESTNEEVSAPPATIQPEPIEQSNEVQKIPFILRRLLPHNFSGLSEGNTNTENSGRRSRRQRNL